MTEALVLIAVALTVALYRLYQRVEVLERRLAMLAGPVFAPPPSAKPKAARTAGPMPADAGPATIALVPAVAPAPVVAPPSVAPVARTAPPPRPRMDFETLVGGRLPIWIGGLALVVGGIFLVRLSIESGWLTPAIRTFFAAAFAAALLGASEAARRLPATRDDPRVGQALAGAGIASAYATLYLAAALYHLVGPLAGFAAMLAVTALGLFMALRHGPPTAIMALAGGFAAPLVAGYDAAGIGPLLIYLGLFVAALLALAAVRGWAWLALSALAAAFGWAGLLIWLLPSDQLGGIGAFIVALGIGGTLAAPRAAIARPVLRMAPLLVALVQLLVLAPALDFGGLAWSFYLVLSAAALFLAWRDPALLRAGQAASVLVTLLIAAGLVQGDNATTVAWPIAVLLFAGAGGLLSRRADGWAGIALFGSAGPVLAAQLIADRLIAPAGWVAIDLSLAAGAAALAWAHRDRAGRGDGGLVGGIAVTALGTALAVATIVPDAWVALAPLAAGGVLLAAMRFDPAPVARLALIPWAMLLLIALSPGGQVLLATIDTLSFDPLPYPHLPTAGDAALFLALPGAAVLAAAWRTPALFGRWRRVVLPIQVVLAVLGLYVLLKQPLAIGTLPRFVALGFTERAILTDLALLAGWLSWTRLRGLALGLVVLGLARILWFDLIGLDPVLVAQAVGGIPVLNAATLHFALAAMVVWRLRGLPLRHWIAAALTLAAVLATIRQVAHGTLLTGPLGLAENWGYSAAMLALAIAWLWRGLGTGAADLRRLGLLLLTATTLKVFLIDAAALEGVLRILSFMGLGVALIAIGWAYRRFVAPVTTGGSAPPAGPAPA